MRTILKVLFGFVAAVVILIVAAASWFFFYSGDLPDVASIAQFAPTTTTSVAGPCSEPASVAIPSEAMGQNFRNALSVVEARPSYQISRTMFCASPSKILHRQLAEMRTSAQMERRYSPQVLLTIYANRIYFGEGQIGVQSASQYFFHKNPDDLNIAEAALLAGLAKSPSYFSPIKHPDRALKRRNEVIDAMVQAGSITVSEAEAAKIAPIEIVVTSNLRAQ